LDGTKALTVVLLFCDEVNLLIRILTPLGEFSLAEVHTHRATLRKAIKDDKELALQPVDVDALVLWMAKVSKKELISRLGRMIPSILGPCTTIIGWSAPAVLFVLPSIGIIHASARWTPVHGV